MTTSPSMPGASDLGVGQPVVVGIDGSAASIAALRWAAEEARSHGRPLTVIHVLVTPATFGYQLVLAPEMGTALAEGAEACLDQALVEVFGEKRPANVRREVKLGHQAGVLVEAAKDASLLVVGARGHGGFALGSVSDRCVHHATCPVVVVRD